MSENMNSLLAYCREKRRMCPQPMKWHQLWELLPNRRQVGIGWEPPLPLILAGWGLSDQSKTQRLAEHIEWAEKHGALETVSAFLRNLQEEDWHHIGD